MAGESKSGEGPSHVLRSRLRGAGARRAGLADAIKKGRLSITSAIRRGNLSGHRKPTQPGTGAGRKASRPSARGRIRSWSDSLSRKGRKAANRSGAAIQAGASDRSDGAEGAIALQTGRGISKLATSGVRRSGGVAASAGRASGRRMATLIRRGGSAARRSAGQMRKAAEQAAETTGRAVTRLAARVGRTAQAVAGAMGGQAMIVVAAVMAVALVLVAAMTWMATSRQPKISNVPAEYQADVERAGTVCPVITSPLIAAQIEAESGWNPNAGSPAGAQGIAQFMPGTWSSVGMDGDGDGRADVLNPHDAIWTQAHYMCSLAAQMQSHLDQGRVRGDVVDLALAAYNAGSGAVLAAGGIPPYEETRKYVARIRSLMVKYQGEGDDDDFGGGTGQLVPPLVMYSDGWHVNVPATGTNEGAAPTYDRFQCTWWAAIRRAQIGRPVDPFMGNGAQWAGKARSLGWQVSSKPSPGDVMCFQGGVHGSSPIYGHVAVVEAVNADGSIMISQSGTGWMAVVTETISAAQLAGFGGGVSFIR